MHFSEMSFVILSVVNFDHIWGDTQHNNPFNVFSVLSTLGS